MQWHELYPKDRQPDEQAMAEFIKSPLWEELNEYLLTSCKSSTRVDYSPAAAHRAGTRSTAKAAGRYAPSTRARATSYAW